MKAIDLATELGEDQKMIWETVRDLAAERVAPEAAAIDRDGAISAERRGMLAELGLYGITAAEAAGGAGMDAVALMSAVYELGKASGGLAVHFASLVVRVIEPLTRSGNASLRERIDTILVGAARAAFAGDERIVTKDDAQAPLKLESHGSGYLLNGRALDVLDGGDAEYLLVAPVTGSWVLVATSADGVSRRAKPSRLGLRGASVADYEFTNVKLGAEDFVLSADEGVLARAASDTRMRTMLAAIAAGVIDHAMREAVSYGKDRRQFGKPISDFEAMREKIADIASHSVTALALALQSAKMIASGGDARTMSRIALLQASERAVRATDDALQIHGGYGFSQEYAIERLYRDAMTIAAMGGGTDSLRLDIAEAAIEA